MSVRLVTKEDVKARMALSNSLLGVDATIESALTAAHLRVETEYDTRLTKGTYVDTFYLDPTMHNGVQPGGMYRLQLSKAFVRVAPYPEDDFGILQGFTTANEEVSEGIWRLDATRGILYVPTTFDKRFVQVSYSAGFDDGEEGSAPDWLKEAILAYVPVVFNFSNPANNDPKQEKMNRQSGDHALAILYPYKRNIGFCLHPVF